MCKIIAESGANHNGDRRLMLKMIKSAAKAGADVVKFQSWRADNLRKDWPDYDNALAYYRERELSEDDHRWLIEKCAENNIEILTTAFDLGAVSFLASLGMKHIKIASPDCNSWKLIDQCVDNFEHVYISTGMHSSAEVKQLAKHLGNKVEKVTALHCVSLYPVPPENVNMLRIAMLMRMFPNVGYSDHSMGTDAAKLAVSYGVECVEMHFTVDRTLPGKDQAISKLPKEIREICQWRDKVKVMMLGENGFPDEGARKYIGRWGNNA